MTEMRRTEPGDLEANLRRSWWPGWIWGVPIAALGIGIWLLVRALAQGGTDIIITFDQTYGLKAGDSDVTYRGVKVGKVTGLELAKDGKSVEAKANIKDEASDFLRTGTRFWLRGAHPSISNLSTLGSILSGPTVVMEPGPGTPAKRFVGLPREPIAGSATEAPVLYRVSFQDAVGDLSRGDTVTLRGFSVGVLQDVGFHYDPETKSVETPITLGLYPSAFHLPDADALRTTLDELVAEGWRARLDREPLLIGEHAVSLDLVPGAPEATMTEAGGLPEIPVAPGGGLNSVLARLNKVPIDRIAQNVLDMTHHADTIVSSPQLQDSLAQLDASLQEIRRTVNVAGPKITKLAESLRYTADKLDQATNQVQQNLGGPESQHGLTSTLRELSDAARSVRSLSDYLERHPESLIRGKPGD
jgi:paraquat-inducible protein B